MVLMRMSKALALAVFVLPLAIFALPSSTSSNAAVLPNVTAYALDNSKLTLPTDFSAPLNLLILSFKRDQQDEAATWLPVAQQNGQPSRVQPGLCPSPTVKTISTAGG